MPKKSSDISVLEQLEKDGKIVRGSDPSLDIHRVPFGIKVLDDIIGGGLPRKRVAIITGDYSAGKSALVQAAIKNALRQDLSVAYIDTERSFDRTWWEATGIHPDDIYVSQPSSGEEASDIAVSLAQGGIDVVCVDSIAGMMPANMEDADAAQQFIGVHARLVTRFMSKVLAVKHNSIILCTNQLQDVIGANIPATVMPGGKRQGFSASIILRVRRQGWLEEKGAKVGFNIHVEVLKNKVGRPMGECVLPFLFTGTIDQTHMYLLQAKDAGLVKQSGPWFKLLDGTAAMGISGLVEQVNADPALMERLLTALGVA